MRGHKRRSDKLSVWQERLSRAEAAISGDVAKMDEWETLYNGSERIKPVTEGSRITKTPIVRNICAEIVEAQIDNAIPMPKVTALYEEDEALAAKIESMLRNEIDRLPFERINDLMERVVSINGGGGYLLEWDNQQRTHTTTGELAITPIHPKTLVPQDGVEYISDMDYCFIKLSQTKSYIKARYGVDVEDESETEPEIRAGADATSINDDLVTQYIAYYRNTSGGVGVFSWCGDTVLEDIEDYQARRSRKCSSCGMPESKEYVASEPTMDGSRPPKTDNKDICPYCGGKMENSSDDYEEIYESIQLPNDVIEGARLEAVETDELDEFGIPIKAVQSVPNKIPYYKPNVFPAVIQKNISAYGRFWGVSDVEKIATHQNLINRIGRKIVDKLCAAGSYLSLPPDANISTSDGENKVIRVTQPDKLGLIKVFTIEGDISQDMAYLNELYAEARQIAGITDAYQGRVDTSAKSGVAKEFAANQSAGRLESKRICKYAAYAELYEAMFKFKLAYADEPRPITITNSKGEREYSEFNRYEFLKRDAAGEWYWNDRFLFSCDVSSGLTNNRQQMWQEVTNSFVSGTFGNPADLETLIMYWGKMELLHYPGAGETKQELQAKLEQQRAIQLQQMKIQQAAQDMQRVQQIANTGTPVSNNNL